MQDWHVFQIMNSYSIFSLPFSSLFCKLFLQKMTHSCMQGLRGKQCVEDSLKWYTPKRRSNGIQRFKQQFTRNMSASKKLSKQVAHELRRHVKSRRSRSASKQQENEGSSGGHIKTLAGCVAFVGVTASMPLIAMQWIGSLNDREEVSWVFYQNTFA